MFTLYLFHYFSLSFVMYIAVDCLLPHLLHLLYLFVNGFMDKHTKFICKYIQWYILLNNTLPSLMSSVYTIFISLFQLVICTIYCGWLYFAALASFIVFVCQWIHDKCTEFCISTFNGTYYRIIPYHHWCQMFTLYLFHYFSLLFVLYIAIHCFLPCLLHLLLRICLSTDSQTSIDVSTSNYTLPLLMSIVMYIFLCKEFQLLHLSLCRIYVFTIL